MSDAKPRRYFRGWEVVAGCFLMAMVSWGLGFYGTGLYLAYLVGERGFGRWMKLPQA